MEGGGARALRAPPAQRANSCARRREIRTSLTYGSVEGHARAAARGLTAGETRTTLLRARGAPAGG